MSAVLHEDESLEVSGLGPARTRAPVGTSTRLMYSSGSNSTTPSVDSSKFEVARMVVVDELQSVALKVGLSNDSDVANDIGSSAD